MSAEPNTLDYFKGVPIHTLNLCIQILQIWNYFVTTVTFDCVSPWLFNGKLRMAERTYVGLRFISEVASQSLAQSSQSASSRSIRPDSKPTGRRTVMEIYVANLWQANCCFFCPILFPWTCNLIGKSLTPSCLSCFSVVGGLWSTIRIDSLSGSAISAAKVKGFGTIFQFLSCFVPNNFHSNGSCKKY